MKIVIMLPKTKITGLKEISKRKRSLTHTLSTHPHTCAQTQAEAGGVTYKLLTWASFKLIILLIRTAMTSRRKSL